VTEDYRDHVEQPDEADPAQPADQADEADEADQADEAGPASALEQTGNPDVDGVLASLDSLSDAPVADHVAVFETAHDRLRAALTQTEHASPPQG